MRVLSTIVSWRDRDEIGESIASLANVLGAIESEIIVVNLGGHRKRLDDLLHDVPSVAIIDKPSEWFNKPVAQNIGAKLARGEDLFFCDCDILFQNDDLLELVSQVRADPNAFGTLAGVRETDVNSRGGRNITCFGYELTIRTANGAVVKIVDNEEDIKEGTRQAPGLLLVKRKHFDQVGGYNSALNGWGWEDQDMICRLTLYARARRITHGSVLHISHSDHLRIQAFPIKDRWESRDRMFRRALNNYDEERFLGTYDIDTA